MSVWLQAGYEDAHSHHEHDAEHEALVVEERLRLEAERAELAKARADERKMLEELQAVRLQLVAEKERLAAEAQRELQVGRAVVFERFISSVAPAYTFQPPAWALPKPSDRGAYAHRRYNVRMEIFQLPLVPIVLGSNCKIVLAAGHTSTKVIFALPTRRATVSDSV